jgi:hypothetical protein
MAFVACPIQMKAASGAVFSVDRKYNKFDGIIIAFVWYVGQAGQTRTYALSQAEATNVAKTMGYTRTDSWRQGRYVSTRPSPRLEQLLDPFLMSPAKWRKRVLEEGRAMPSSR